MSSRLFINVREREGLGYYIRSSIESYSGCGYLLVKAGIDNKRVMRGLHLIMKELREIREKGVTEAELKKAKEYIKGHFILELEDSRSVAGFYANQELLEKDIDNPLDVIAKINKVTVDDIENVAKKYFLSQGLNLAIIGNFEDRQRFQDLLRL